MTLKLYGHPASLCTRRVLLVLAEKGIEYEFVNVDFMAGEQKVNFSNLTSLAAL
jgi:glutathione S-transferase